MATFYEGDGGLFDAALYGSMEASTSEFIQDQFTRASSVIGEAGKRFVERARDLYENVMESEAVNLAKVAVRKISASWQRNVIRPLESVEELQTAPLAMQRYLMAEPTIRKRFHDQTCDGYSSTYVDTAPGVVGEAHYDYRRARNTMVSFGSDDADVEDWVATTYYEDLVDGDRELIFVEQVDISNAWDLITGAINTGDEDPTSIYGGML